MSYARADEGVAVRVYEALMDADHDVWLDTARLPPGLDWWEGVRRAIDQCLGVLFLVSEESSRSPSVLRELAFAVARGKPIVPIEVSRAPGNVVGCASRAARSELGLEGLARSLSAALAVG